MNTIYLLDALFLLLAGTAAVFAFGVTATRQTRTFKMLLILFLILFTVTLIIGYLAQPEQMYELDTAKTQDSGVGIPQMR